MIPERVKRLLVAVFSLFCLTLPTITFAQEHEGETTHEQQVHEEGIEKKGENKFDANEVIFGHVLDAHEFHFFSYTDNNGEEHHATIPLPVILYSPQKGLSVFSSGKFHHGHEEVEGYKLVGNKIVPVEPGVQVYDFSLSRNVVQMIIALTILVLLMTSIAKKYRQGQGINSAPKGWQNAIEPVITFIRDEVAKPNLAHKYPKYLPYLLTVFFFILINNIFGLIPGSANVTGNIAFTAILGVISFLVIIVSGNKHYWGHIVNPPVPFGIKFIMVPVEILGMFTKPFALIIRLFANMLAGHIIIICLISLIFIFGSLSRGIGWGFSVISIAFSVFIFLIEILVAFIQAFIFTNLTAVFIGQAIEDGHHTIESAHNGEPPTEPVII
jgi:F-type H+-transporting ATPase subunit a